MIKYSKGISKAGSTVEASIKNGNYKSTISKISKKSKL